MQMNDTATAGSNYASIMVVLHSGQSASGCVRVAADIAEDFGSRLIGVGVADHASAQISIRMAECEFRALACHLEHIEWRSEIGRPDRIIASQSRAADLVVLSRYGTSDAYQGRMGITPTDLVMAVGKPLLIVPPHVDGLCPRSVVVAWKDTREARRAVRDALPLLKKAEQVTVITVDGSVESAHDLAEHLRQHRIPACGTIRHKTSPSVSGAIIDQAIEYGADLIVSGAYGHSRTREWMFGGVTLDLLEETPICCLMSN